MVYHHISRLVTAILFNDIDTALQAITGKGLIAYSPMHHSTAKPPHHASCICIDLRRTHITIPVQINGFNSSELSMIHAYLSESIHHFHGFLQIILKRSISSAVYHISKVIEDFIPWIEIAIMPGVHETEKVLSVFLPLDFFRLFSKDIDICDSSETLAVKFLNYFEKPLWMLPDFRIIANSLTQTEFTKLFNHLQKQNLLTPYQIYLLTLGFPEVSGVIKRSLSKNSIKDVLALKKNAGKMNLGKRDIIGGIYSIEESIFFILKKADDLEYSLFIKRLQRLTFFARNLIMLQRKEFRVHISEIIEDDLLLPVLSSLDDLILGMAFSMDAGDSFLLAKSGLSERKQMDIMNCMNNEFSFIDVLSARQAILKQYRSLKIRKSGAEPERLEYLLSCLHSAEDYQNLLLSVGWFQLSTAMKGLHPSLVDKLLSFLPPGARILIEDVLSGTLNPNIIHDEGQMRKAKKTCVEAILELFGDGTIAFQC